MLDDARLEEARLELRALLVAELLELAAALEAIELVAELETELETTLEVELPIELEALPVLLLVAELLEDAVVALATGGGVLPPPPPPQAARLRSKAVVEATRKYLRRMCMYLPLVFLNCSCFVRWSACGT